MATARPPVKNPEQRRAASAAVETGPAEVTDFREVPGAGFDSAFDVTVTRSGAEANDHGPNLLGGNPLKLSLNRTSNLMGGANVAMMQFNK